MIKPTIKISEAVGSCGSNVREDVILIQRLLNIKRPVPYRQLTVDGRCGPQTIQAIELFQRMVMCLAMPDGSVEPAGATFSALAEGLTQSQLGQLARGKEVAWGAKVTPEFKAKVIDVSNYLGINPDYLMSCMAFETGETFSSSVKNKAGSGATGLIQFMPSTAKGLGTTTESLAGMTPLQQLDYVKQYFGPYRGRLHTLEDVLYDDLYSAAIGKSSDYKLYQTGSKAYAQNKGFDLNKDGAISLAEISSTVRQKYSKA